MVNPWSDSPARPALGLSHDYLRLTIFARTPHDKKHVTSDSPAAGFNSCKRLSRLQRKSQARRGSGICVRSCVVAGRPGACHSILILHHILIPSFQSLNEDTQGASHRPCRAFSSWLLFLHTATCRSSTARLNTCSLKIPSDCLIWHENQNIGGFLLRVTFARGSRCVLFTSEC